MWQATACGSTKPVSQPQSANNAHIRHPRSCPRTLIGFLLQLHPLPLLVQPGGRVAVRQRSLPDARRALGTRNGTAVCSYVAQTVPDLPLDGAAWVGRAQRRIIESQNRLRNLSL